MAKQHGKNGQTSTPDLPDVLANAMTKARDGSSPPLTKDDEERFPNLWQFLEVRLVKDPRYKGTGQPPQVLREPMVMLSWDRMTGSWKWTLTDKVLNVTGVCPVPTLPEALQSLESALAAGKVNWKEKRVS